MRSSQEAIERRPDRGPLPRRGLEVDSGLSPKAAHPWTRDEIAEFKRIYGTRTDEDLSRLFACRVEEIRALSRKHALAKDKGFASRLRGQGATRMPRWLGEEVALLQREYAARSNLDLARKLGRSVKSLVAKAHHLGLRKSRERLRGMGRENVGNRYAPKNLASAERRASESEQAQEQ